MASIFRRIKNIFVKPKPQTGTVFLKPSESITVPKGVTVSVPETGQTTVSTGQTVTASPTTTTRRSSSGGGGGGGSSTTSAPEQSTQVGFDVDVPEIPISQEQQISPDEGIKMEQQDARRTSFFSFGTRDDIPTVGVPFIKPSEREAGIVGFVPTGNIEDQLFFTPAPPQTSPQTPFSSLLGRTKEDIIFTQRNILEAEKQQKGVIEVKKQLRDEPEIFIGQPGVEQEGDQIILTEKFFEEKFKPSKESTVKAFEFFEGLPESKQQAARRSSVITGATSLGLGVVEFGGTLVSSLGQQSFEEGEKINPFSLGRQFKFEGETGKFRRQPGLPTTTGFLESPTTFIKEKATSPQLVTEIIGTGALITVGGAGALKNIRSLGFSEGATTTLSFVSPIRVKPGVFAVTPSETTPIEAISFKSGRGDVSTRVLVGKGKEDPISIFSFQQSEKGVGFGETLIETPATFIKPSGKIVEGTLSTGSQSFFGGKAGAVGIRKGDVLFELPKFKGGVSDSLTQQRASLFKGGQEVILDIQTPSLKFKTSKGAGSFVETGEFTTRFGFGKRQAQFKTTIEGRKIDIVTGEVTPTDFIREPTGSFRFKPSITGKEFDLNKIIDLGAKGDKLIGSRTTGGKKTPLSSTFQQQELASQLQSVQSSLTQVKTPKAPEIVSQKPLGFGLPRSVGGLGLTEEQLKISSGEVGFDTGLKTRTRDLTRFDIIGKSKLNLGLGQESRTRTRTGIRELSGELVSPLPKAKQRLEQIPVQREKLKEEQAFKQTQEIVQRTEPGIVKQTLPGFGFEGFLFPPIKIPFGGGGRGRPAQASTRKFVAVPTFLQVKRKEEFGIGNIKPVQFGSLLDIVGTPEQIKKEVARRKKRKKK